MTALAYKDGIMAADTQVKAGNQLTGHTSKLIKTAYGSLVGAAGLLDLAQLAMRMARDNTLDIWLDGTMLRPLELYTKADDDIELIVVKPDGVVVHIDGRGLPIIYDAPWHAEGSACRFLMGAMAAGADAQTAVELACEWDVTCGGEVQTLKL